MATTLAFNEVKTWLNSQPQNTADTPYEIIITNAPASGYSSALSVDGRFVSIVGMEMSSGVTSIGSNAFNGCRGLTSVTIPSSVTSISNCAFYYCSKLTSITIPEGVTSIGTQVFQNCLGLTSITIPDSVTSIGNGAFQDCSSLTSITIPDSVTSIGSSAFSSCSSLTSINIPEGVTSIGDYAFRNCSSLTSVFMYPSFSENLMQSNSFSGTPETLKLYVSPSKLSGWQSAALSSYGFASGAKAETLSTKKWIRIA